MQQIHGQRNKVDRVIKRINDVRNVCQAHQRINTDDKRINGSQRNLERILSLPCIQAYIKFNTIMGNAIAGYEKDGKGS